jgi:uncharacterized protein
MRFHSGEIAVQERAQVRDLADEVGEGISDFISLKMKQFLEQSRMVVLGTVDLEGWVWASVAAGQPGFIQVPDENTVAITTRKVDGDPLFQNLSNEAHAALLVVDFATRRRVRVNGRGIFTEGQVRIYAREAYGNCPRYLQERMLLGLRQPLLAEEDSVEQSSILSLDQQRVISRADTFFMASDHPQHGADVSHKGGNPGFVRVSNSGQIAFPDYNGNRMFNTLGNITVDPRAGLLFIDFDTGRTLQIAGRASIDWDAGRALDFAGAERVIDYEVAKVIDHRYGFSMISNFLRFSRFNP